MQQDYVHETLFRSGNSRKTLGSKSNFVLISSQQNFEDTGAIHFLSRVLKYILYIWTAIWHKSNEEDIIT